MAASRQFHYYRKCTLLALMIGCAIGDLLFIIPMIIVIGSNGTTSSSLSLTDSLLYGLAGWGILILLVEVISIFVRDWRGAMTLRVDVGIAWTYRGRRARAKYWLLPLSIIFPYIFLPIYLIRTWVDQRHVAGRRSSELKKHVVTSDVQKDFELPTEGKCRACHQPLQVGAAFCSNCGVRVGG